MMVWDFPWHHVGGLESRQQPNHCRRSEVRVGVTQKYPVQLRKLPPGVSHELGGWVSRDPSVREVPELVALLFIPGLASAGPA